MKIIHIKDSYAFHQNYQALDCESKYKLNERMKVIAESRCRESILRDELKKQNAFGYKILTQIEKILNYISLL